MKSSTSTALLAIMLATLSGSAAALPVHEARGGDIGPFRSVPSVGAFTPAPGTVSSSNGNTSASGNSSNGRPQNGAASGNNSGGTTNPNIISVPGIASGSNGGTGTSGNSGNADNDGGSNQNGATGGNTSGGTPFPIFPGRPLLRPPPTASQGSAETDTNNNKHAQGGTMNGVASGIVSGGGVIKVVGGDASAQND
ncbi:hypothetical protein BD779DRAFT_665853 [Infundibulicybe gibba]|nr:hypothetical protein BD779DRAFT_665853 [Infundibulicybe gibba]